MLGVAPCGRVVAAAAGTHSVGSICGEFMVNGLTWARLTSNNQMKTMKQPSPSQSQPARRVA